MSTRVFADRQALEDLLIDTNYEHGETPELVGYDKVGRPVIAWLFDGGDDAPMAALVLGGEDAGRPEVVDTDPDDLLYPVTVLLPESWSWLAAPAEGWEPDRYWRSLTAEGGVWAESSDEAEVRESLRSIPGGSLQRSWRTVQRREWRDAAPVVGEREEPT